jgi:hypothetical protein
LRIKKKWAKRGLYATWMALLMGLLHRGAVLALRVTNRSG